MQLQRRIVIKKRRWDFGQNGVKQRLHVAARALVSDVGQRRPTVQAAGENYWKVELVFSGAKLVEQFKRLVHHPIGARTGTVDFVDHNDDFQTQRERFFGHKTRLRHRALNCVNQQQRAVDHRQHTLNFATEIGVAGRVNNVDSRAFVDHRAVFGEDGDAAFAFDVIAVHDAFTHLLVRSESAGLFEQAVHERGFAVVDVSNDGDIAQRGMCSV